MASPQRPRRSADHGRNPNVFDDEYEVDVPDTEMDHLPAPTVAQEPDSASRTRSRTPTQSAAQRRSTSNKEAAERRTSQQRTWRSSIAKDARPSMEIISGGSATQSRMPSSYAEAHSDTRNRPTSTASSYAPFEERSRTPVHGRSASGHLHEQFSQSGLPHSSGQTHLGVSHQSGISTYSPARPAHPYGLYQQNSIPLDEDNSAAAALPIGFPGRNNSFQRRIGPDGEEQDIIGPDGHTEELPPYSRYPEENAKVAVVAPTPPAGSSRASPVDRSLTGARNTPVDRSPHIVPDALEQESRTPSRRESVLSEKAWGNKTWNEKRRTRVCGGRIPLWALLVVVSAVVLVAVIIGGVIGGLVAADNRGKPPTVTVTSTQSMLDASLIPAPTGILPIPTGVYMLPLGIPVEQQKSCITNADQLSAWTCNTPPQPVAVDIGNPPSGYNIFKMHRSPPAPSADGSMPRFNFSYGTQSPKVVPMQRLFWAIDTREPLRGPALHFQTTYDKLVILDSNQFPAGRKTKREAEAMPPPHDLPPPPTTTTATLFPSYPNEVGHQGGVASPTSTNGQPNGSPNGPPPDGPPPGGYHHRKQALETGDQPWFCYWNQTWIEGFIYMQSGNPSRTDKKHDKAKDASATTTAPSSDGNLESREIHPDDPDFAMAQEIYRDAMAAHAKRVASASPSAAPDPEPMPAYSIAPTPTPKPFPYIMKLQERRMPGSQMAIPPYCQKMFIPEQGPPEPVRNDDGHPIRINLIESEASVHEQQSAFKTAPTTPRRRDLIPTFEQLHSVLKRDEPPRSCHCLWVTPPPPP